jgi:hypothetical protein
MLQGTAPSSFHFTQDAQDLSDQAVDAIATRRMVRVLEGSPHSGANPLDSEMDCLQKAEQILRTSCGARADN